MTHVHLTAGAKVVLCGVTMPKKWTRRFSTHIDNTRDPWSTTYYTEPRCPECENIAAIHNLAETEL